jgi:hypothetical protein
MATEPGDVRQSSQASAFETKTGAMEGPKHKTLPVVERGDPTQTHDGKYFEQKSESK